VLRARFGLKVTPDEAELLFWEGFMRTRGYEWPHGYERRMDPLAPLSEELIARRLPLIDEDRVRILDVGSGPTSVLGQVHDAKELEIVAVDPLAKGYRAIFRRLGLTPPHPVQPCSGEDLPKHFSPASFHFAFARNALDHSLDPVEIIGNMIDVVRPGGFVVLRHHRNEGERQGYADLHRWNFDLQEDDVVVWRPDQRTSLSEAFADRVVLDEANLDGPWLTCVLRKSA
jgi:SAM-dependent methyltransferase